MPLYALVSEEIFAFLLIFARIGTIMFLMPMIGEAYIPTWIRLGLAFMFTAVLTPVVAPAIAVMPESLMQVVLMIAAEVVIGLFIGGFMRILISTLTSAGVIISFVSGFSAALMFNPLLASQGLLHAALFTLAGTMLIFALDLHHLFFIAMADSYLLLPELNQAGDMADFISAAVNTSFATSLKLSAPVLLVGLLLYGVLGIASRLMPQLQIFFIALPLQILISFAVLLVVLMPALIYHAEYFADSIENLRVRR